MQLCCPAAGRDQADGHGRGAQALPPHRPGQVGAGPGGAARETGRGQHGAAHAGGQGRSAVSWRGPRPLSPHPAPPGRLGLAGLAAASWHSLPAHRPVRRPAAATPALALQRRGPDPLPRRLQGHPGGTSAVRHRREGRAGRVLGGCHRPGGSACRGWGWDEGGFAGQGWAVGGVVVGEGTQVGSVLSVYVRGGGGGGWRGCKETGGCRGSDESSAALLRMWRPPMSERRCPRLLPSPAPLSAGQAAAGGARVRSPTATLARPCAQQRHAAAAGQPAQAHGPEGGGSRQQQCRKQQHTCCG